MKTTYNHTFWIFLCIILAILNVYSLYQKERVTENLKFELSNIKSQYELDNQLLLSRINDQFRNEGIQINQEIEIFPDYNNQNKIKLKDLIQDRLILVLNFSEITYKSCLESEIIRFKEFADKVGMDKVLLLSSYNRNNDLLVFKRLNRLDIPIYNKKDQDLGLLLDDSRMSIFLIDSKTFKTHSFFIPDKNNPWLSERYYSSIKRFFDINVNN